MNQNNIFLDIYKKSDNILYMNRDKITCFMIGMITGYVIIAFIFLCITTENSNWQPKAIARGAAHWTNDGTFEWNTITNK